ncbi:hypothetical protein ABIA26_001484 [Sinorhizobium fredii]
MFEAFVTICMLAAAGPVSPLPGETCRIALLPGFAAETQATCEHASRLAARQPAGVKAEGLPFCALRPRSALAFSEAAPGVFVHRGKVAEPDPANVGDVSNIALLSDRAASPSSMPAARARWAKRSIWRSANAAPCRLPT